MTLAANEALADFSNQLIYAAMLVYALTFVAYTAEWVFGTRSKVARTAAQLTEEETAETTAVAAGERRRPAVAVRAGGTTTVLERSRRPAARVVTRDAGVPDGPGVAAGDARGDLYGRIAVSLTTLAFVLHAGGVLARAIAVGRGPWGNMYEFSTAFSAVVVAGYLGFLLARRNVRWMGLPLVITVLLDLGLAVMVLYNDQTQLVPALDSVWMWVHVPLAIICGGLFYVGALASVLYLFRERYEKQLAAGEQPGRVARSVLHRMPSAVSLDGFAYRINAAVFPLWTFTIVAGAIWAETAWGRYWGWDPKETWSFITWIIYACYLHARSTAGWKGRRAAYLAIAGLVSFLINYYGVNIFFEGLHSYGGV